MIKRWLIRTYDGEYFHTLTVWARQCTIMDVSDKRLEGGVGTEN